MHWTNIQPKWRQPLPIHFYSWLTTLFCHLITNITNIKTHIKLPNLCPRFFVSTYFFTWLLSRRILIKTPICGLWLDLIMATLAQFQETDNKGNGNHFLDFYSIPIMTDWTSKPNSRSWLGAAKVIGQRLINQSCQSIPMPNTMSPNMSQQQILIAQLKSCVCKQHDT